MLIFYSGKNKNLNVKKVIYNIILTKKFGKELPPIESVDFGRN
jgi:hypothetical protein